jgi:hypothetical protein
MTLQHEESAWLRIKSLESTTSGLFYGRKGKLNAEGTGTEADGIVCLEKDNLSIVRKFPHVRYRK